VDYLRRAGIHAVVHGHQSREGGQRLALRAGLLHIECDITLDENSRRRAGLPGPGAGATLISPEGRVMGISSDHPRPKLFDPYTCLARPQPAVGPAIPLSSDSGC
jgi:hypothetical protein